MRVKSHHVEQQRMEIHVKVIVALIGPVLIFVFPLFTTLPLSLSLLLALSL